MTSRRTLVVHGTPSGGTCYTTAALRAATGLDIRHERMGADGIVCGWFLWGARRPQPAAFTFDHEWRLYRDPLRVLEALPNHANAIVDNGAAPAPWNHGNAQVAALRRWVLTHERLEGLPTLHVDERYPEDFARLVFSILGKRVPLPEGVNRNHAQNRWPKLTWPELRELDAEYAARALAIAEVHR